MACIDTCAGEHKATEGSRVQASGRHLGNVKRVLFRKEGGGRTEGALLSVSGRSVRAKVPADAADGRPRVIDRYDNGAVSPNELMIVTPDQIPDDGNFKLEQATANPDTAYYFGTNRAKVDYTFSGSQNTDVRIQVVHRKDGKVVDSWVDRSVEPNVGNTAVWRGGARSPSGGYKFRIGPISGSLGSTNGARFGFYGWKFPVRGAHQYWDGFGAPRSGHTHMGQDVGAACGTPVVAARGGRVQYRAYQSAAGNYVVIDGRRDNHDYVYMHLKRRARVHEGQLVRTGEQIGKVGQTGDATGCHLHFEYWKNDWWNGGRALPSVTKALKRWDRWS